MQLHDTIVAVSSPPGPAARGIVRLSGPQAHQIAATVFEPLHNNDSSVCRPCVADGCVRIDLSRLPASAWTFAAPKSYTRQDMVELHLLGSPGVLGLLVERLIAAGARRAEAGEFTARAYLNGALDLAQVHGVAALISAQSDGQRRAAARLLEGSLSKTAHAAREELADLLSLVEGALDFADEPIEFITPVNLRNRLGSLAATLQETLDVSMRTERWGRAPHVLLAGLPNAGKSSLLNRLSGHDRAIATPIAGTTRDTLTASLHIREFGDCVLIDSAGIPEPTASSDVTTPVDQDAVQIVEGQALAATHTAAADADLIVWVVDASSPAQSWFDQQEMLEKLQLHIQRSNQISRPSAALLILNKSDISTPDNILAWSDAIQDHRFYQACIVSAATGVGCEALKHLLGTTLAAQVERDHQSPVAIAGEHHDALQRALDALHRACEIFQSSSETLVNADLVALELHAAADALGVLVGKDVPDDLLGRVFARFCVGK